MAIAVRRENARKYDSRRTGSVLMLSADSIGVLAISCAALSRVATTEPVRVMVQKNGNDKLLARIVYSGPVHAPVAAGQPIGAIKVWRNGNVAVEEPLYATEAVGVGTTMQRAFDGASELVIGMFRAGIAKL